MDRGTKNGVRGNRGSRRVTNLRMADFPNADDIVRLGLLDTEESVEKVDVLLVNPPTPDGGLWIRSQHRVGRKTRENMVWPQISLAQMAALLHPPYSVRIIDANADGINWTEFSKLLDRYQPRYYLTQVTAPTLENDMYGCFLAKARGAQTIAFGTHVTPIPRETMKAFPALDYVLYGEPDLTLRDLIDHQEQKIDRRSTEIQNLFKECDSEYQPLTEENRYPRLDVIKGLVWRNGSELVVNQPRPFIPDLDNLPIPLFDLLPLQKYRMPMINGPFAFVVTSRGCPAGCSYCIKHVSYQYSVRLLSPTRIMKELRLLKGLGIHNVHMYADLFTVNRDQVMDLCNLILDEGLDIKWTCNSRVDYVDKEMLSLMARAGCWFISWGIESGNQEILARARKGTRIEDAERALRWSKEAGIRNWGYFIIGLPGETEETIQETIDFAKHLPLDIALFHIAAPYPGTPFFFEVVKNKWFRPGTRWEQVDMDKETVLDYPGLSAEQLLHWQRKAFWKWALRPGPMFTYLQMLFSNKSTFMSALSVGAQHISWKSSS